MPLTVSDVLAELQRRSAAAVASGDAPVGSWAHAQALMGNWLAGPSSFSPEKNGNDFMATLRDDATGMADDDLPLMRGQEVAIVCALYCVGVVLVPLVCRALKTDGSSIFFKIFLALHNVALCLYSAATFLLFLPIFVSSMRERGFMATYCYLDDRQLWHEGLSGLAYVFYLSKVWEFIDTVALFVKGKPASWLQTYHHVGAFFTMWLLVVSRSQHVQWFVIMNAAVHTIMYFYYFMSLIGLSKYVIWAKQSITTLQLVQFIIGICLAAITAIPLFNGGSNVMLDGPAIYDCADRAGTWALMLTEAYLFPLFVLFVNFYIQSYIKSSKRSSSKAKSE